MRARCVNIGGATLYHGDAREVMPTVTGVGAIVSDPPYGIGFAHGGGRYGMDGGRYATKFGRRRIVGDNKPFNPKPLNKQYGHLPMALFGANHYASRLPDASCWLIWDKREGLTRNDFADCELIWTNRGGVARLKRHLWNGMFKASEHGEPRVHPMQKPVAVMAWVIQELGIKPGTLVADPFMGSGTTGIAALQHGCRFVGVEIDLEFFEAACRRIEAAQRQGDLAFPGLNRCRTSEPI